MIYSFQEETDVNREKKSFRSTTNDKKGVGVLCKAPQQVLDLA